MSMIATVLALHARLTRTMLLMLVLSLERGRKQVAQESQMGQCGANSAARGKPSPHQSSVPLTEPDVMPSFEDLQD